MNALIALAAFVAIALVGWAIAELKGKSCVYQNNEEEEAALERTQEAQKKADYGEMDIHDVMETISTKGFKAVWGMLTEEHCVGLLEHHGIKPTANRIVVVKALASAMRPLLLAELESKIGTIDKSGIFRTLNVFKENHLVHLIEDGCQGVRYELCHSHHDDEDDDMHVHFHCTQCHTTFCIDNSPIPTVELPEGYTMSTANYVVKGICPDCNAKR